MGCYLFRLFRVTIGWPNLPKQCLWSEDNCGGFFQLLFLSPLKLIPTNKRKSFTTPRRPTNPDQSYRLLRWKQRWWTLHTSSSMPEIKKLNYDSLHTNLTGSSTITFVKWYRYKKTRQHNENEDLATISETKLARSIAASKLARIEVHTPRTTETKRRATGFVIPALARARLSTVHMHCIVNDITRWLTVAIINTLCLPSYLGL